MTHPNLLALDRHLDATPGFAFALWSNPSLLAAWWGPEGHHLTTCEADLRPGGTWRFNMEKDGQPHWIHGTYHEVLPDQRLMFSYRFPEFGVQSVISLTFTPEGQGTCMHFLQTGFPDEENWRGHQGGWLSSFAILDDLLLKLHGIGSVYPTLPPAKPSTVAQDLMEARRRHDAEQTAQVAP
ncbi:SRPBCC domain-containing protein [Rhodobacter sp. SY28-1]|uniref:SRPBCC family protein n=1 Tax=Rhodobacter sp. SY28-1 TaxID=2562317 RepID=UPI0010C13D2A|nr:SRPBCC domain-containing protein [Rhodobacter sp. SY28-1]